MFYHGIKVEYIDKNYRILSPRRSAASKTKEQLQDRKHLIEQFGLEPIHLLESSEQFSEEHCLSECFEFGDAVFVFSELPEPMWQLSRHEVGVPVLDLCRADYIFTQLETPELKQCFADTPVHMVRHNH